jgi:predicted nuclease of restriction endonuclease-like (RecB) superfamily
MIKRNNKITVSDTKDKPEEMAKEVNSSRIIDAIRDIISDSRNRAIRSVDFERVQMYWKIGRRIVEEEQGGGQRAEYGKHLLENLSSELQPEFGTGFSERILRHARQFYRVYPKWNAVRSEFNWSQYRLLISIQDDDKREYYELQAINNSWTGRELERQINSSLYERLLLSSNKESVLEVARNERIPQTPQEIIKDPMCLEFLGLHRESSYYEKDLESTIITHLEEFILELGDGFSFVARQKRILLEDDEFFIDLVFYNRLLKCFVIFELKTHKLTHEDLGQLQMYVNYYDRKIKLENENSTIGIILCAEKNNELVKFSLPKENQTILASEYQLHLPTEEQLLKQIELIEGEFTIN